mmetsp:Transcript_2837/g.3965  ORF Transcript_2837/g.3965 Transcript_2837/m.3965 type:complete len:197 (-) Transcript_2837:22-612(-)|eukprot:CAMPEP_0171465832 /NCGR_PEP_ID=MMETSP0945-20130129/8801_1 /TAXON_ID=109269 /ORGANISM="Vaucheria litorea, Strain CCMP2940" /LENGTH=196 /DNA_ID=CAMNT_0011993615 /DNA_START=92 /DNA_END=682 /DNA_ORIENTATION=+
MSLSSAQSSANLDFFHLIGLLKKLKRTGWVNNGIQLPESVSDHMHRMSVMSLLVNIEGINRERCTMMAIVHDLAEALAGDITPYDGISQQEKYEKEFQGMEKMLDTLKKSSGQKQLIFDLWMEYEKGETLEAIFVKDLDKFEMILQADEYERDQGIDLENFFESCEGYFKTEQVQSWDKELRKRRAERKAKINQNL